MQATELVAVHFRCSKCVLIECTVHVVSVACFWRCCTHLVCNAGIQGAGAGFPADHGTAHLREGPVHGGGHAPASQQVSKALLLRNV